MNNTNQKWSTIHEPCAGFYPRVAWVGNETLVLNLWTAGQRRIVVYDVKHATGLTSWATTCESTKDVTVDSRNRIHCCDRLNSRVCVYATDGTYSHSWDIKVAERNFSDPISVCIDSSDRFLVLHKEKTDDDETVLVTLWSPEGCYVRDVIVGLTGPGYFLSFYCCMRLHDNKTLVVLMSDRIRTYDVLSSLGSG